MEETNFQITENIEVSSTFRKIQSKNLFSNARKIDKKIEETCNNLSKDFENNRNNSYNINNASLNLNGEFYFEDKDPNIFDDKNIEEHNGENTPLKDGGFSCFLEKDKSKDNNLLSIDIKKEKEEDVLFNIGENLDYLNYYDEDFKVNSQKDLNYNCDTKKSIDTLKHNEKKELFTQEESKDTLLRSKSSFDIGNIYHNDYNDETIISNTSVDDKKDVKKGERINDNKSFYELNVDEMPNRKNLLEELYINNSVESTEQNRAEKQKTKEIKILGKIFKGVKNNNEDEKGFR